MLADVQSFFPEPHGFFGKPERVSRGAYVIHHLNPELIVYGHNCRDNRDEFGGAPAFGVCDTPTQYLAKYDAALNSSPESVAVFFSPVPKDGAGFRWAKWGDYVGEGKPTKEFLDDEEGFPNGVHVFYVLDLDWKP